jgi:hypothetical protein
MKRLNVGFGSLALLLSAAVAAQQPPPASPDKPAFDADACMRHCREMAETRQKMMEERKAMAEKRDASWNEVKAQVEAARKLRGEKKVAALEAALEKLVAFHESMHGATGRGPMMGMDHGPKGDMMGHPMAGHGMMGHGRMGMCPCCGEHAMMGARPSEPAPKP